VLFLLLACVVIIQRRRARIRMPQRFNLQLPQQNLEPLEPEEVPMLASESPQDSSFSDATSHNTGHAQDSYVPYTVAEYNNPHAPIRHAGLRPVEAGVFICWVEAGEFEAHEYVVDLKPVDPNADQIVFSPPCSPPPPHVG
jgi:hypothetical protein